MWDQSITQVTEDLANAVLTHYQNKTAVERDAVKALRLKLDRNSSARDELLLEQSNFHEEIIYRHNSDIEIALAHKANNEKISELFTQYSDDYALMVQCWHVDNLGMIAVTSEYLVTTSGDVWDLAYQVKGDKFDLHFSAKVNDVEVYDRELKITMHNTNKAHNKLLQS